MYRLRMLAYAALIAAVVPTAAQAELSNRLLHQATVLNLLSFVVPAGPLHLAGFGVVSRFVQSAPHER
jgi:hypothetical protein